MQRYCSVQKLSCVQFFPTPRNAAHQASLSITNSQTLLKLMSIKLVMTSNHLIFCRPLLLLSSVFPSIRVFSSESVLCIRWPKYWSFSFSISPSSEYSGLISFRMEWLDLLAVQGTLKCLLQHHSLKALILWLSAFFMVQLSCPYLTTGKIIALTIQTFVGKISYDVYIYIIVKLLSHGRLFATPWTVACQSPLSIGILFLQERILEKVAMPSSRASYLPRDQTQVSCVAGRFFTV